MTELTQIGRRPRARGSRSRRHSPQQRYMAFLSYSHSDEETAGWLHDRLERFRVPPRLVGRLTEVGPVPHRLTPIFRDRHELAAAGDLSDEIEEAIAGSRFLIVLCSPKAATSRWIDEEIDCFKRIHGEEHILAAIIDGEPYASTMPGREAEECFPPALRVHYDRRGKPTAKRAEPIAADLRDSGDGRQAGLLKIVAGMLGVGLDDLVQREVLRRQRRMTLITAASVAGMLVASGLAYTAVQARDEARDQRREAEGLIGFMLGDLRQKLEPLGRLDVLDSVGVRALEYYEGQDQKNLGDAALAQRAKALTLMGEMAFTRGDLDGALARYREAMASTGEAARRNPDAPQGLFDHAQNVFWVGYIDYQRGRLDKANAAFRKYRALADRMIALAPARDEYRLERIYADTNLGTVLMDQRKYREAAAVYQDTLAPVEALAARTPTNRDTQVQLSDTLAWLSDAREKSGELEEALALRERQVALLSRLWAANRGDTDVRRMELTARRAIARLLAAKGQMPQALAQAGQASAIGQWLTRTEANNTEWLQAGAGADFDRAALELASGRADAAAASAGRACDVTRRLIDRDRSVTKWRTTMQFTCLTTKARVALGSGRNSEAADLSRQALAIARGHANPIDRGFALATADLTLGQALTKAGQREQALGAWQRAATNWPANVEQTPREIAEHVVLLRRLNRGAEASDLARRLSAMGYREPTYLTAVQQGGS
ncbi:toll/interleukin-1 receptor domain-containing protein [Sphingomonas sp. LY29]|uniref:toll/interleukin-1 receptor domain-containing protein n=1 Tax=Sphingomonas sp. LY29 TaxID=3095341 RepID=UPI002D785AF6|nr:toll/interleukin-1 receptor domain-containing protein [Sphingomonas sp. LY29]WRP25016.1 toll/interleukin-1 receptor domain-containing protein [Sphingomonas sp. LY29]